MVLLVWDYSNQTRRKNTTFSISHEELVAATSNAFSLSFNLLINLSVNFSCLVFKTSENHEKAKFQNTQKHLTYNDVDMGKQQILPIERQKVLIIFNTSV